MKIKEFSPGIKYCNTYISPSMDSLETYSLLLVGLSLVYL